MGVTYEQAHAALVGRISSGAVRHSERVATTAASLAETYGVDPDAARLAGLLHDWDREIPAEALVARAHELGIDVTEVDAAVPYLLHGPVAEADVREALPETPEDVLTAIGAHTFGVSEMSALSMVVYIADTIEPARSHGGVEDIRASVGRSTLEDLFAETYAMSIHHLLDKRRRIHPQTLATWNTIAGSRG